MLFKDRFDRLAQLICALREVMEITHIELAIRKDAALYRFSITFELFWRSLKQVLLYEQIVVEAPRHVLSAAYKCDLINDEAIWLNMLDDKRHINDEYRMPAIFDSIKAYLPVFEETYTKISAKYGL